MKLSEKGFKALLHKVRSGFFWGYEDDIHKAKDHDFKPDDFQDTVILTIDEAKAVNEAIEWLCSTLEDYERKHDNTPALIEGWNQMDFLEHRIEQAEGKR